MKRKLVIRLFFVVGIAIYPFIVYFGVGVLPPSFFALVLAVLLLVRLGVLGPEERGVMMPVLAVFLAYAIATIVWPGRTILLYYPVLVNLCLCAVFAGSLWQKEPFLLRVVRARGVQVSEHGPKYLHRLTAFWAVFFALNGAVAIWTTTLSMKVWTIYNGLVSYIIVALLMGGEWLFRQRYKKRMDLRNP